MEAIRADLQAHGWKMGKDRYNAIAKRLTAAGHLARVSVFDESTQRPTWVTRVYRNPANNSQYVDLGIAASVQVSAETQVSRDSQRSGFPETRASPGQSRIAENPQSGAESRKNGDLETHVSPGQSRNAEDPRCTSSPPHPPGEEDSSSPNPRTDPARSLPSQREQQPGEREPEFAAAELRGASEFLQRMQRWQAGAATARRCAPKLLWAMRAQGWPALAEMDDAHRVLLEADILKNTGGAASWTKCLPGWVEDLRLYATVKPRTAPAAVDGAARLALVAACTACDAQGWVLDDDDDGPMRRCAHPGVSAGTEVAR
ncbi:hypothetical protein AB0F03_36605 [Streptomyces sp. NPDC028722]|uniref:hypothetical protein n=1 Tax=Streptomyces sp. NPDC028722 TaxID=3155016 RepID=UPI0033F8C35F